MKQHMALKIILILCGLSIVSSASAHPNDEPLTFRKYLTDDGRVIYSNIPKSCFSKGLLTCENLHPIYGMPVGMKSESSTKTRKTEQLKNKPKAPQVAHVKTNLEAPQTEPAKTNPEAPQTEPAKIIKSNENGLCGVPEDPDSNRTKEEWEQFLKIHGCL